MEYRDAADVRWQEIRRELNATEVRPDRLCECTRQHGLSHAGHIFDEQVPAGEDASHGQFEDRVLADQNGFQVTEKRCGLRIQRELSFGSEDALICRTTFADRRERDF